MYTACTHTKYVCGTRGVRGGVQVQHSHTVHLSTPVHALLY